MCGFNFFFSGGGGIYWSLKGVDIYVFLRYIFVNFIMKIFMKI